MILGLALAIGFGSTSGCRRDDSDHTTRPAPTDSAASAARNGIGHADAIGTASASSAKNISDAGMPPTPSAGASVDPPHVDLPALLPWLEERKSSPRLGAKAPACVGACTANCDGLALPVGATCEIRFFGSDPDYAQVVLVVPGSFDCGILGARTASPEGPADSLRCYALPAGLGSLEARVSARAIHMLSAPATLLIVTTETHHPPEGRPEYR